MNKLKIILCLFIPGLIFSSCQDKIDCSAYKNGKFYYNSKKRDAKILINRSDSLQTEIDTKFWIVRLYKVKWHSPCEYEIERVLPVRPAGDTSDIVYAALSTTISIVEVTKDFYVFKRKERGPPLFPDIQDTVWVDK